MDMQTMNELLYTPLDLYCERTAAGPLAEPLNLASNAGFLAVALILYSAAKRRKFRHKNQLYWLSTVAVLVGVGSAAFHSYPNRLTQAADVAPIALFVTLVVLFYFKNLFDDGFRLKKPLILCVASLILAPCLAHVFGFAQVLAGGEFYLGIIPALGVLAIYDRDRPRRLRLILTALVFGAAYGARTLDPLLCENAPYGTHFIWHLLTSIAAYVMASIQMLANLPMRGERR